MSDDLSECPECQAQYATHSKTCSRYPFRALDEPGSFERRVLQRIEADPRSVLAGDLLEMLVSQGAESEEKVRFYDAAELPSLAGCCREAAEICYGKPPRVKLTYDGHDFSAHFKEAELSLGRMTREEVAQAYPEVQRGVDPGAEGGDRTVTWPAVEGAQAVSGGFAGEENWGAEHEHARRRVRLHGLDEHGGIAFEKPWPDPPTVAADPEGGNL
jgi:hypothetical protein